MIAIFFSLMFLLSISSPITAEQIFPANEKVVEGIAAILTIPGREPIRTLILYSDLERYRFFFASPEDKSNLFQYLNQVILQHVLQPEARRFILEKPTQEAIKTRLSKIQNRFVNNITFEAALRQTGLSEVELEKKIQAHLWVEQLLDERIKGFIFINPKTIEDYFEKHPEAFLGRSLTNVSEQIERILIVKKEASKKKEYLQRIKAKAEIEILLKSDFIR